MRLASCCCSTPRHGRPRWSRIINRHFIRVVRSPLRYWPWWRWPELHRHFPLARRATSCWSTPPNGDWSRASRSCGCCALPLELSARVVGRPGLEPGPFMYQMHVRPCCQGTLPVNWWTRRASNPRPPQCHCGALPTALQAQMMVHPAGSAPAFSAM